MAYQVLARKWRPHDFSSLIGQDHVVKALTHALTHNRLHHAYLFTGTRGVGKTTISRILAKCLNCTGPDGTGGITATPCGVCDACTSIDQDRFVDYIEMDAASTRGLEDMVKLLERAKYPPTNARFKVYMIDEVHQLTSQAFNAMLKTLEEPPEYVKFILATTDPQKVPVTVLSRCLQFSLKNLSPTAIADHMKELLEKEKVWYEPEAVRMLAEGAKGSMRDGLSLLDQAIAYSAEHLSVDSVREMLGTVDTTTIFRLLSALGSRDAAGMIAVADEIGTRGLSYEQALKDIAVILQRVSMAQFFPQSLSDSQPDAQAIKHLTEIFQPDEVQLYYQTAIHSRNELNLAPDDYSGFTMALLRMLAFAPYEGVAPKKPVIKAVETPKLNPATSTPAETKPVASTATSPVAQAKKEIVEQPKSDLNASSAAVEPKPVEKGSKKEAAKLDSASTEETKRVEAKEPEKPVAETSGSSDSPEAVKTADLALKTEEAASSSQEPETQPEVKKNNKPSDSSLETKEQPSSTNPKEEVESAKASESAREAPVSQTVEAKVRSDGLSPPENFEIPADDYYAEVPFEEPADIGNWVEESQPTASVKEVKDEFEGIPVKMNPWLKAAKQIPLKGGDETLLKESEFVSYENGEMVISNHIGALCDPKHAEALAEELKKVLGSSCTLKVIHSPKKGSQTLSRLLKQEYEEEKKKKLDKISSTKRVKEIIDFFGISLTTDNLTLFDKEKEASKK